AGSSLVHPDVASRTAAPLRKARRLVRSGLAEQGFQSRTCVLASRSSAGDPADGAKRKILTKVRALLVDHPLRRRLAAVVVHPGRVECAVAADAHVLAARRTHVVSRRATRRKRRATAMAARHGRWRRHSPRW